MAEAISEKSRGLTFAEQQMLRHGWQPGKGLGRHEDGRSEPIKVKVKCDKGGVGHKLGEQFAFNWWDHVFNKASSNLSVEDGQEGVLMKKVNDDEEDKGMISNKRPLKAKLSKGMQYGCFVKSATLLCGQEQPEQRASSSDDSSDSEDEDQKLDLSSATNLTDAQLLKVCGGRTAHKGARHGLTMSAKLARLEQQEQEFMAKYGKKLPSAGPRTEVTTAPAIQDPSNEDSVSKKSKRKKDKQKSIETEEIQNIVTNGDMDASEVNDDGRKRKKKKKKSSKEQAEVDAVETTMEASMEDQNADHTKTKKKKKKKKQSSKTKEEETQNEPREQVPDVTEGEERTNGKSKAKKRKMDSENENGFPHGDSTKSKKVKKKGKRKDENLTSDC